MKPFSLPKSSLLRTPDQYKRVYRQGKRLRGNNFSIIFAPNDREGDRLGISVHGVKRAVQRNRIKRILREYYRLHREQMTLLFSKKNKTGPHDIVFAVRSAFTLNSPMEVKLAIRSLLN
ncbi:MAG: ribonuclease P protein component [Desulfobulbaceae bacterium]|nr:ribonuclease P protein component [Desulfobulbaceae bacterium]MCK5403821.1 ribonuclease P protein component [Desulfobulbaceae bacterium]